jgi:transcriptional regulator of arginine metabolism
MDKVEYADVLGTIAGDDTVLVMSRDPQGGEEIARRLLALAQQPSSDAPRDGSSIGPPATAWDASPPPGRRS